MIWIGTKGAEFTADDVDNDPTEQEIIIYDPMLGVGQIDLRHVDGDGDPDVKFVGTKPV